MMNRSGFESQHLQMHSFMGRQALDCLQTTGKVVVTDEVLQMLPDLIMAIIVIALDSRLLNDAVHALDLPVQ